MADADYENTHYYPGLVRPYIKNSCHKFSSERTCNSNGKSNRFDPNFNQFSKYDDDSSTDHYYLVPGKLDLRKFPRAFKEINECRHKTRHTCTKSGSMCQSTTAKHDTFLLSKNNANGDYCTISTSAKVPIPPPPPNNYSITYEKTSMENLATKLISSDIYDSKKKKRTKSESSLELHRSNKKSYKVSKMIDICTCMCCVKTVRYHFSEDREDYNSDPCSCSGGVNKRTAGRWCCMSILALLLPCLICYIPAKLCHNRCSKEKLRTISENGSSYELRYIKDPNDSKTYL